MLRSALAREVAPARRREILSALGALERDVGRTAEAVEAYRTLIASDPDDRDACAALAALYEGMEAWKELCDLLEAQAERMPADEARSVRAHLAELAACRATSTGARPGAGGPLARRRRGRSRSTSTRPTRVARVLDDARSDRARAGAARGSGHRRGVAGALARAARDGAPGAQERRGRGGERLEARGDPVARGG